MGLNFLKPSTTFTRGLAVFRFLLVGGGGGGSEEEEVVRRAVAYSLKIKGADA